MLKLLRVQGFKSLADIEVEFPALTVLFGPNASGKSTLLDALLVLSRVTTERTLADALGEMSRHVQRIEAKRFLKSRSEHSHLAPQSQLVQDAIDAILFRCYGLSDDDAKYISRRLKEML
jgi:AAA15 family ATPase/GTPase